MYVVFIQSQIDLFSYVQPYSTFLLTAQIHFTLIIKSAWPGYYRTCCTGGWCTAHPSSDRNGIIFNNKMRMHLHTNLYTLLSVGLHVVVVEVVVVVVLVVMLAIS